MNNEELIRKAVKAHFACQKSTLQCDNKLEDYITIAYDFMHYFRTGKINPTMAKALKTRRYRTKKILIERYLKEFGI